MGGCSGDGGWDGTGKGRAYTGGSGAATCGGGGTGINCGMGGWDAPDGT